MPQVKVITDLVSEPVTLAEITNYVKLDESITVENTLITDMITAARELCEQETNLSFGLKTIEAYFYRDEISESFGDNDNSNQYQLILPYSPHSLINSINAIDSNGASTLLVSGKDYRIRGNFFFEVKLMTSFFTNLISGSYIGYEAYLVNYQAGYGCVKDTPAGAIATPNMPKVAKIAIMETVKAWYQRTSDEHTLDPKVRRMLNQISVKPVFS
jgi:hypothetical protein